MTRVMMLPAIFIALTFHEFAHAKAADMLGDPTPKSYGRVTLNPIAHVDILGLIALMVAGFGWGKPVPVDGRYFKNFKRDEIIVSAAGVTMNFILAFLTVGILKVITIVNPLIYYSNIGGIVMVLLSNLVWINLVLMVFNLLPIPPLDGFNIVGELFNLREKGIFYQIYEKGPIILIMLIIFNITGKIIGPVVNGIFNFLMNIFF